jgi:hypothetical protein
MDDVDLAVLVDAVEASRLDELLAAWLTASDERALLARALRIDRPLLQRRPELALPCLYRRLAFVDAGLGARIAAAVRGAWLRALRAPVFGLDAGLVEEHRGDAPAWTTPMEPSRWKRGSRGTYGRLVLVDDRGDEVEIDHRGAFAVAALALDETLVVVPCTDTNDDDLAYLVDTATRRIRWRISAAIRAAAAHPDGTQLASLEHDEVMLRDLADGEATGQWSVPDATSVAFAPDGAWVATGSPGGVIRIWEVARAVIAEPGDLPYRPGRAAFSRDGTRLLTGDLLSDAITGARIARLPLTGRGSWLEGGPGRQDWFLRDGVVVELLPWSLRLWNTQDGRQLAEHARLSARIPDRVAVSPDGQFLAIARDRPPSLELHRIADGARLFAAAIAAGQPAFAPDGAHLHYTTADDVSWVLPTAQPDLPRRGPPLPAPAPPPTLLVDGVLQLGDAAIPDDGCDAVVSTDGRRIATSHGLYALERADG